MATKNTYAVDTSAGPALVEWETQSEAFDFLIMPSRIVEDDPAKAVKEALAAKHRLVDAVETAAALAIEHDEPMAILRYDVTRLCTASPVREAVAS